MLHCGPCACATPFPDTPAEGIRLVSPGSVVSTDIDDEMPQRGSRIRFQRNAESRWADVVGRSGPLRRGIRVSRVDEAQQPAGSACGTRPSGTVVPSPGDRVSLPAQIHRIRPTTARMIPIVHWMEMPVTKPLTSRITPRMITTRSDLACALPSLWLQGSRHGNCRAGAVVGSTAAPASFGHIRRSSSSLPGTAPVTGVAPRRGPAASACADGNDEAVRDSGGSVRAGDLHRPLHQQRAAFGHGETPPVLRFVRHE